MKLRLRRGRRPQGGGLLRSRSGLESTAESGLRQEGGPRSRVEAQHGPLRGRAVAYTDAAADEPGSLDACPLLML